MIPTPHKVTQAAGGANSAIDVEALLSTDGEQFQQGPRLDCDQRGFLIAERHPEIGNTSTGGWLRYSAIDAKGHASGVDTDDDVTSELVYQYDKAERLQQIRESAPVSQSLAEYFYASANSGTDKAKGRLRTARRYNRLSVPWDPTQIQPVVVLEEYFYRGKGGRVSQRDTSVSPLGESFTQSWKYDDLGNVTSIGYPRCTHTACTGSAPGRTVAQTFTRGRLSAVAGFASTRSR